MAWYNNYYPPYISAAEKAKKLAKQLKKLTKQGYVLAPVKLESKVIAKTFWGKAWCDNLERYRDLDNRLPRGRTYVRNGSVVDLKITPGAVAAMVNGSELYTIRMTIEPVSTTRWNAIRKDCAGGIDSLVELLQGRLSKAVMERICEPKTGLFPAPTEIKMTCSCPDFAHVCKHIAAVIYGIGAWLDEQPELLFRLRQVDEKDLIATADKLRITKPGKDAKKLLATDDLSALFGLDMGGTMSETAPAKMAKKKPQSPAPTVAPKRRSAERATTKTKTKSAASPKKTAPVKPVRTGPSGTGKKITKRAAKKSATARGSTANAKRKAK